MPGTSPGKFRIDRVEDFPFLKRPERRQQLPPGAITGQAMDQCLGVQTLHIVDDQIYILILPQNRNLTRFIHLAKRRIAQNMQ